MHDNYLIQYICINITTSGFGDFQGFVQCWYRGVKGIGGNNNVINNMVSDAQNNLNKMTAIKNFAPVDTETLNTDHSNIVGTNAFLHALTYTNYTPNNNTWLYHSTVYTIPGSLLNNIIL